MWLELCKWPAGQENKIQQPHPQTPHQPQNIQVHYTHNKI